MYPADEPRFERHILCQSFNLRWKMSGSLVDVHNSNQEMLLSPNKSSAVNNKKKAVFVEPQTPGKTCIKATSCGVTPPEAHRNMGPLTTPTKRADVAEPWTPTSNLKMLISAASPEIRNREKEKIAESTETEEAESSTQECEPAEETEKLQLSRKEKSLGLLCHKFLARYPNYPNPAVNNDICLDDVAAELNVERRRIYDIMNVLESLNMVSRLAKNRYTWHGRAKLAETLAVLGRVGEASRYGQQIQQLRQRNTEQDFELDGEEKENEDLDVEGTQREMSFSEVTTDSKGGSSRKDKSLRVMSQKFVMLFLVSSPRVVSLEVAAKILIGEDQVVDQDKSKFKTKIRRLYDIANVLSSLGLIKKVHVTEERGRKPAFKWTGPEELPSPQDVEVVTVTAASLTSHPLESRASLDNCTKNLFSSPSPKRGFTRHHSLVKLARSIQDDRRKISSAPSSPLKPTREGVCGEFLPSKMDHLAAICKMQLDQQSSGVYTQADAALDESSFAFPGASVSAAESRGASAEVQYPVLPYLPPHGSPLIPVLLPPPQVGRSYALYVHHASLRPRPPARPPPTSMAVRSMTFESPGGAGSRASPVTVAPVGRGTRPSSRGREPSSPPLKRPSGNAGPEGSPSKVKKAEESSKGASPKLGEILQARLKARGGALISHRPSPRALHLDPEFSKPPESPAPTSLDHALDTFLDKEEKVEVESSFLQTTHTPSNHKTSTPVPVPEPALPLTHLHTETLIPTGYLIPISQQPLLTFKEAPHTNGEASRTSTPTYIYHTPTAGSRPPPPQELTPTSLPLPRGTSLSPFPSHGHHLNSPSPAIINFTLQNLGLIPPPSSTHDQHAMLFVKPVSPAQPLTLITVPQPLLTTPKAGPALQHSFFHTPVSALPVVTTPTTNKSLYIPQRKLQVSSEDT